MLYGLKPWGNAQSRMKCKLVWLFRRGIEAYIFRSGAVTPGLATPLLNLYSRESSCIPTSKSITGMCIKIKMSWKIKMSSNERFMNWAMAHSDCGMEPNLASGRLYVQWGWGSERWTERKHLQLWIDGNVILRNLKNVVCMLYSNFLNKEIDFIHGKCLKEQHGIIFN